MTVPPEREREGERERERVWVSKFYKILEKMIIEGVC